MNQDMLLTKAEAAPSAVRPGTSRHASRLPEDLLVQGVRRLGILSIVFALVFFTANFVFMGVDWLLGGSFDFFDSFADWGPATISITLSLVMFGLTRSSLAPTTILGIGLFYQVVFCFGVAMAEYWGTSLATDQIHYLGLSWVAVCMIFFAVVIPATPRNALLTALASGATVPAVLVLSSLFSGATIALSVMQIIVRGAMLYGLIAGLAYMGARSVYMLGTELGKAREIGSYRLVELLGKGGMGEVWKANHKMLARPAAIKLIRPEVMGERGPAGADTLLKRFEREAQATSLMRSPHTIEVYDFGIASDATFYYVMEFLDGFDLESLVKQFGPLPAERVVFIMRQVCHSLGEAHEAGLIHRDIKPANIYVSRYGREVDFVKVLDFGLVKTRVVESNDPQLTAANVFEGTPAYTSPEQVLGNRPIDARTDIYAAGCVAYWLLTGRLVFEGTTAMETMSLHAQAAPARPEERFEGEVPEPLGDLIMRCLEKDPDRRPATADEFAQALDACPTESAWTPERARRWWDTHRPR
ncbi:MAG: serine/threonine protein kinase [Gemmatimonadetes bacterium]|nr:serine/threonine protein kinase [Gemmatimonadota bacterium]